MCDPDIRQERKSPNKIKEEQFYKNPLRGLYGGLKFGGSEIVKRKRSLTSRDFHRRMSVIDKNKVAEYDEKVIRNYWNSNALEGKTWKTRVVKRLKHGIIKRTFPILLIFISGYYTVYTIFAIVCATGCLSNESLNNTQKNETNENKTTHNETCEWITFFQQKFHFFVQNENQNSRNKSWLEVLKEEEYHMTRISTLLIGFYVGFTVRTWWQQIRIIPTVDSICIATGSFLFVSSEINEDKVFVEIDKRKISIKQFKKDIVRLLLLSWAMCFCRISRNLKAKLPTPQAFNEKQLLTSTEYNQLRIIELRIDDGGCWLENWTIPLLWIAKLISSVGKETQVKDLEGNVVQGIRFKEPKEMSIAVFKFKEQLEALSKQYHNRTPDLMLQCITLALYSIIFLGTFAAQGSFSCSEGSPFAKLIISFPFFYCVKYILLIGWLKTAKDLQNPFGEDESNVKLSSVLDIEIWRASNMLFQTIHYRDNAGQGKYQHQLFDTDEDNWDDTWHETLEDEDMLMKIQTQSTIADVTDIKKNLNETFKTLHETRVSSI